MYFHLVSYIKGCNLVLESMEMWSYQFGLQRTLEKNVTQNQKKVRTKLWLNMRHTKEIKILTFFYHLIPKFLKAWTLLNIVFIVFTIIIELHYFQYILTSCSFKYFPNLGERWKLCQEWIPPLAYKNCIRLQSKSQTTGGETRAEWAANRIGSSILKTFLQSFQTYSKSQVNQGRGQRYKIWDRERRKKRRRVCVSMWVRDRWERGSMCVSEL